MKLHPIQNSFEAGELSPRMLGRSDADTYRNGVLSGKNMVVDIRGPMRSRAGSEHAYTFEAECARLETFQVDANSYFNAIFSPLRLDISSLTGAVATSNFVSNGNFLLGDVDWTPITNAGGSVLFEAGICHLDGAGAATSFATIRQPIDILDGAIDHSLIIESFGTGLYEIRIGTTAGASDILNTVTDLRRVDILFNPGGVGATTIWLDITAPQDVVRSLTSVAVPDDITPLGFDTPWTCQHIPELYFVPAPDGEAVYVLHRGVQTHKITYDDETDTFDLIPVTFTDTGEDPLWVRPPEWGPGIYDPWPGVGTIYQGRLWLMSTRDDLEAMWGSRSGEYEKFYIEDTDNIVANDAILNVPMENFGRIQWVLGTKRLVVGTINAEYVITSTDGLIRPNDIQILKQSTYGSKAIQPIQIDDQILYVSPDGRKVRAMSYLERADNWISEDLTLLAEHLTKAKVIDMVWAPNPDNLLTCLLADGIAITCTYDHNINVAAWTPHETTGFITSMAVGHVLGSSYRNVLVKRQVGKFSYEVVPVIEGSTPLDSFVRKANVIPFNTVEGLDHLEGYEVQIIADGAVHPTRTVVGGIVTLQNEYTDVYVGLGYSKKLITLPFDKGSATGSGAAHFKRYNKILVRVLDSAKPIINGDRPPTRNPSTPMNTAELPRTEDVEVANLGWDRSALVTIEQDLPLALTVIAIFGELGQENF